MTSECALRVSGLHKSFGSVFAANNINLTFAKGEVISIIGTNGAGKTTFLNMVTGYLKPDSGTVSLFGQDVTGWPPRRIVRAGVGRSFQIPQLFDGLSIWDNLMSAAILGEHSAGLLRRGVHADLQARCTRLLEQLGALSLKDAYPENLAGGSRKLLDIGMAIISKPSLLLLDEPTSGVSEQEKHPLMERVLEAMSGHDLTTILVEHDMDIVQRYSNRVLAFVAGEVAADGTSAEVLAHPTVRASITGAT